MKWVQAMGLWDSKKEWEESLRRSWLNGLAEVDRHGREAQPLHPHASGRVLWLLSRKALRCFTWLRKAGTVEGLEALPGIVRQREGWRVT